MTKLSTSQKYGSDVQMYTKKNGDITYFACYLDPNHLDKNGRPIRKRLRVGNQSEGITQADAKSKSIELAHRVQQGEKVENRRSKKITLLDLSQIYFTHMREEKLITINASYQLTDEEVEKNKRVEKNIKNDESRLKNHLSCFLNRDPETIDNEEINDHKKRLRNLRFSDSTINSVLTLLSAILNLGIEKKLISIKPIIKKIKGIENSRERFLTILEIEELKTKIADKPIIDMFVKLCLSTGGRLDTIRHIKVKDINFETKTIILNNYKKISSGSSGARYCGYFSESISVQLKNFVEGKGLNEYIFPSKLTNYPLGQKYFQENLKPILDELFNKEINSEDRRHRIVLHSFRHTFASHLAINGTPLYKIQILMNHSTPKMTQRYAKLDPSFGIAEINKLSFI
ncbi:MAG: site-specific integrase [Neisseriaceae bacterium]|nr:MAG: site-specific integrase [Neisseriaceae bacterium]